MTAMTPADVSGQLGIKSSTLRKYSLLLEQQGVSFERNANNSRKYSGMHLIALQKMMTLMSGGGVSVEDAVLSASEWFLGDTLVAVENDDTDNGVERHDGDVVAAMIGEIRILQEEVSAQREVIDGFRVSQEQRDTFFIEVLEDLQGEIKKLNEQAALPEPVVDSVLNSPSQEQKKKGFFSRFFK